MKCIKGESRLNPSARVDYVPVGKVYQRGITIESQPAVNDAYLEASVSKGNHD